MGLISMIWQRNYCHETPYDNRMIQIRHLILLLLFAHSNVAISQNISQDSLVKGKFPLVIGSIGFATDSMEIVAGNVPGGEVTTFEFEIYNFGNAPVTFTNGRSNHFVTQKFEPKTLMPSTSGRMIVEFNADPELSLGEFKAEISIISSDKINPYKFLYLIVNVEEGTSGNGFQGKFDSVPHMVFDHYNYDYGHLVRGKKLYHTFLISNYGALPLSITDIVPPKGITIVDRPVHPILTGEQAILRLKINTHGRVGVQHQSVFVHSNDPASSLVILGIHGSVRIYPAHKKTSVQCNE